MDRVPGGGGMNTGAAVGFPEAGAAGASAGGSGREAPVGPALLRYAGWMLALAVLAAAGYLFFRRYVSGLSVQVLPLYVLAVAAGAASFFSPCAFPLLPGYLAFHYRIQEREVASRSPLRMLRLGVAAAFGVIVFDLLLGLIIALAGSALPRGLGISGPSPNPYVLAFRAGLGVLLAVLGAGQLAGWNLKPWLADALAYRTRPSRAGSPAPRWSLFLYGFGYNAAGMGCTGPILVGLVIGALSAGAFNHALAAFVIFSLTMGGLMLLVSVLVGASQETLLRQLKATTPTVKRASSVLLVLVGLFHVASVAYRTVFVRLLFP
ncbi:MAG: cytochrome c biogenesis CcdA family protein [Anaerolineales bacterium]